MVRSKRYQKANEEPIGVMTEAERKAVKQAQDRRVVRGDFDARWRREGKTFDRFFDDRYIHATGTTSSQHSLFSIISFLTFS